MDFKKILIILLLLCLAFIIMGSVQAEGQGTKTTIRGVDFNIPDGFVESNLSYRNNVSEIHLDKLNTSVNSTTDSISYYNIDKVTFTITVSEFGKEINFSSSKNSNATIKNMDGILKQKNDYYIFSYYKDNYYIRITGPNKEFIESVII